MNNICPSDKCTGCYACISACRHNSITMQEDEYGELHPVINENTCIDCGACKKACPNNYRLSRSYPFVCYASWISDKQKRRICASGGIATIMSEYVIKECNGVIFGSRYDNHLSPIITYTESEDELEKFKGSRYVQSVVGERTFKEVQEFLKLGRKVLFIGTPCQIAGLKSFLKNNYSNLITVDLICHGCTPSKYFKEELDEVCSFKDLTDISDVRFRGNDGYNYCYSLWKDNKCVYSKKGFSSYYLAGFLSGVTLRENCFNCSYACPERVSDITIGDFIGLGKDVPFKYPKWNVSSVLINTEKGNSFYESVISSMPDLMNIERKLEERLQYKPSLLEPAKRPELRIVFRNVYLEKGYVAASREVLREMVTFYTNQYKKEKIQRAFLLPFRVLKRIYKQFFEL